MLVRLTRAARRCAAMLVGALYALCVIMPSAAVAFGPRDHAAHCFTEQQLGLAHVHQARVGHAHAESQAKVHVHADGTTHHHDGTHHQGRSDSGNDPTACCGLFGVTAMAVNPQVDLGAPSRNSSVVQIALEKLTGRGPDRINRPPIVPLPL
jgi:hypothetical protein